MITTRSSARFMTRPFAAFGRLGWPAAASTEDAENSENAASTEDAEDSEQRIQRGSGSPYLRYAPTGPPVYRLGRPQRNGPSTGLRRGRRHPTGRSAYERLDVVHHTVLDHPARLANVSNRHERVAVDDDEIGELAAF